MIQRNRFRKHSAFLVATATLLLSAGTVLAQGGNGGNTNPTVPTQGNTQTGNLNPGGLGGGQSSNFNPAQTVDLTSLLDSFQFEEIEQIESERLQPFVGASRQAFEDAGIPFHPRSQVANGSGSTGGGGGGGRNNFFSQAQRGQGMEAAAGNQLGFSVPRGGVRTRLSPQIVQTRPRPSEQVVSASFESRLFRIPVTQSLAGSVNLSVEGGRGILSGTVATAEEKSRAERMARLEPGIYAIENRITVAGQ